MELLGLEETLRLIPFHPVPRTGTLSQGAPSLPWDNSKDEAIPYCVPKNGISLLANPKLL